MTRILWIVGLSIALLVFGGWTILALIAGITHEHLNQKGWVILLGSAYGAWIIFRYLCEKVREPRINLSAEDPPPTRN